MRNFKKGVSGILVALLMMLILMPSQPVYANTIKSQRLIISIENLLSTINISYNNLSLGNRIPTYISKDNILEISKVQYYPLLDNDNIVGLISTYNEDNETPNITFTTAHNEILNRFKGSNEKLAFIGNGQNFMVVSDNSSEVLIGDSINFVRCDNIEFAAINKCSDINLNKKDISGNTLSAMSYGNALNVPSKKQQSDYICWAACTASVGQYKTGINRTSLDVANYLNKTGAGTVVDCQNALNGMYSLGSTPTASGLYYFNYLVNQINSDKPVIAVFMPAVGLTGHAVTLCGYNSSSSSASYSYMDPWDGYFYTSNIVQDGTFTFSANGDVYTLANYLHLN